jgi:hypothetical protein
VIRGENLAHDKEIKHVSLMQSVTSSTTDFTGAGGKLVAYFDVSRFRFASLGDSGWVCGDYNNNRTRK